MTVTITGFPAIEVLRGTEFFWRVAREGRYVWSRPDAPDVNIIIPVGFPTDLASIPRSVWSLLPPYDGSYVEAALCHDYCYASHQVIKEDADLIFYEAMTFLGTPLWKRNILYYNVKWFGGPSYKSGPERWNQRKFTARSLLARP